MFKVIRFLASCGITAYAVGGCVRDVLRGIAPKDVDILVFAEPTRLEALGAQPISPQTGIPVWALSYEGERYELALPRREIKFGQGYKGFIFEAGPGVSLEDDLLRRDFTINAMAMDRHGNVVDPYGGKKDLQEGILRAVNRAAFREDPLRVLRLARFASKGFQVDPETLMLANQVPTEEFEALPVERFTGEILKALQEPYPGQFLNVLVEVPNACKVFFPELLQAQEIPAGPAQYHPEGSLFNHIYNVVEGCSSLEGRVAGLFHDIGKILTPISQWPKHAGHDKAGGPLAEKIARRMKLPRHLVRIASLVAREHMRASSAGEAKLLRIAEEARKIPGAAQALREALAADTGEDASIRFARALHVAEIPARQLGVSLEGSGSQVRDRVFQRRLSLLRETLREK